MSWSISDRKANPLTSYACVTLAKDLVCSSLKYAQWLSLQKINWFIRDFSGDQKPYFRSTIQANISTLIESYMDNTKQVQILNKCIYLFILILGEALGGETEGQKVRSCLWGAHHQAVWRYLKPIFPVIACSPPEPIHKTLHQPVRTCKWGLTLNFHALKKKWGVT